MASLSSPSNILQSLAAVTKVEQRALTQICL